MFTIGCGCCVLGESANGKLSIFKHSVQLSEAMKG